MRTADLDYELPEDLIAQEPIEPRDQSRLLVMHRESGQIEHRTFRDISDYTVAGDLLVANESRVIPARLYGHKEPSGGRVEVLLLRQLEGTLWRGLVGGARTRSGTVIRFDRGRAPANSDSEAPSQVTAEIVDVGERGERTLLFSEPVEGHLDEVGHVPLPPYIHRPIQDPERYQTIYARTPGSAAAPTAGLHFTPELMLDLRDKGVRLDFVTLHVGLDTFRPITEDRIEEHRIHREWCHLSTSTAERVNLTRLMGKRVFAVGTTSVRVLETAARQGLLQTRDGTCPWRPLAPFEGFTDLYITPGFDFRVVDALITNFHLPKSTLLALVMAFAGEERIRRAYETAISERYRFFSFGDAMLII
ncbi:MAG: tRNA preQ1(34) S-adenosylmethionine ribosyltransferase-isomerase QueA [Anaerolineae bacterium]|nr:tRNA preQ1(34) S-adenosylmethionine ribosyltransferase-isomerase QueA [Anaerolineae bacterium]